MCGAVVSCVPSGSRKAWARPTQVKAGHPQTRSARRATSARKVSRDQTGVGYRSRSPSNEVLGEGVTAIQYNVNTQSGIGTLSMVIVYFQF